MDLIHAEDERNPRSTRLRWAPDGAERWDRREQAATD
jgi:hypothetical protein